MKGYPYPWWVGLVAFTAAAAAAVLIGEIVS